MTDPVQEQLSACLDNELPEAELDLLLKRVGKDSQLRASIGRYALIGETLREKRPVAATAGFADRVAAALAEEQPLAPVKQRGRAVMRWLRPVAGMAVAAGVAAVAIIAVRPQTEPQQQMAAAPQIAPVPAVSAVPAPPTGSPSYIVPASTPSAFIPATRLTNYVVAHSEYAAPLGRLTVLNGVLAEEEGAAEEAPAAAAGDAVTQP